MSTLTFPILPLIQPESEEEPSFETIVLRSPSGRRVTASFSDTQRQVFRVKITLRDWQTAPSPWGAYSETALFRYFLVTHKGPWDTFLLDNTGGVYLPGGATTPRVAFVDSKPKISRLGPGRYSVDVEWEVIPS